MLAHDPIDGLSVGKALSPMASRCPKAMAS